MGKNSALDILENSLHFMAENGYENGALKRYQDKQLSGWTIVFTRSDGKREVRFSYFPGSLIRNSCIVVIVWNADGEVFSVEDWLYARGDEASVAFGKPGGVLSEDSFVRKFCQQVVPIVTGPLRSTIFGDDWDAVHFDRDGRR